MTERRFSSVFLWLGLCGLLTTGCVDVGTRGIRPQYGDARVGRAYFLDGAGGGSFLTNWGGGIRDGLRAGGFRGDFVPFRWQTGYGAVSDQNSSVAFKRTQATKLAANMRRFRKENPTAPIYVIGLSAGTAVATYALESLPLEFQVDQVVFLGSSLSNDYDLSRALRRISGNLHVFTSGLDPVLWVGVTVSGTADRDRARAAGIAGFVLPRTANSESRALYAKLKQEEWKPEFALRGNLGGHVGAAQSWFVRDYIVPRLQPASSTAEDSSIETPLPHQVAGEPN